MKAKKTAVNRVVGGVGALALTFATLIAGASAAQAASGPDQPGHPDHGSLTIHKYVGTEGAPGDGTEQNVPNGKPLKDAEFTVWQLGKTKGGQCEALDLSKYEAWESVPKTAAPKTLDEVKTTGLCLVNENGTVQKTDDTGVTKFDNLALGLYYVQETNAPSTIVSRTAPFYVSIPLPHKTENWIYDVHAYPKNQEGDAPSKTINSDEHQPDKGLTLGSIVEWTITQKVPPLNDGESYNSGSIWDYLPASLEYDKTVSVTYNGTQAFTDADYTVEAAGKNITWKITDAGLKKLEAGKTITVVFTTKVVSIPDQGDIDNPGSIDPEKPGYGSEFNGTKIPGEPTPHTYWGQLKITKTDDVAPQANKLAGAEFKVFNNYANGTCPAQAPQDGAIATGVSGNDGVVTWNNTTQTVLGLWIANSSNGPIDPAPSKFYCLYETKAPAGYSADFKGQAIEIKPGTVNLLDKTVVNPKREGPRLPLTGAQGTVLLSVTGLVLAAAGLTFAGVSRRKRQG